MQNGFFFQIKIYLEEKAVIIKSIVSVKISYLQALRIPDIRIIEIAQKPQFTKAQDHFLISKILIVTKIGSKTVIENITPCTTPCWNVT